MGGLDWPFRWQIGPIQSLDVCEAARTFYLCLMPGAEAVVTGGVRFVEPPLARSFNIYLGLLHEDVRLMDGPYGVQRITVEY